MSSEAVVRKEDMTSDKLQSIPTESVFNEGGEEGEEKAEEVTDPM